MPLILPLPNRIINVRRKTAKLLFWGKDIMTDILQELDGKAYTADIYKDYEIRLCRGDEYEDNQALLDNYWRKDHIFVLSKEMFDYQHLDKRTNEYHFIIARERKTNEIHAALGFVPTSQYDADIERMMVWPCIWINRKDVHRKGLGATMYHYLKENYPIETISILGISETALAIYQHWNFTTGKIKQYVMPNVKGREHLAKGLLNAYGEFSKKPADTMRLCPLERADYERLDPRDPIFTVNTKYKSKSYYINRYFEHPMYAYSFFAITDCDGRIAAILIARVCGDGEANCLRIVDLIGDAAYLACVRTQIQELLQAENYEYIDFLEFGLEDQLLKNGGFINRGEYADVIVPNYFEPFLRENVDLDCAFKTVVRDAKFIIFKADADQDRPNVL